MRPATILTALILVLAAAGAVAPIAFEEITTRAGIQLVTENGAATGKRQPEGLVAGVALLDFDGDGYLDIYFTNGAALPTLAEHAREHENRLYRDDQDPTSA